MSERPPSGPPPTTGTGEFPASRGQFPGPPVGSPSWPPTSPRKESRALAIVALAIALIATGLAVVGWFRPSPVAPTPPPTASPAFNEQQIADAKTRACNAFNVVQKSIRLQTGAGNPNSSTSDNPAMTEAQAANARLAVVAGATYLRHHIDLATPTAIADTVRELSESMSDLSERYLAGAQNDDPQVTKLRSDGSSMATRLAELCK